MLKLVKIGFALVRDIGSKFCKLIKCISITITRAVLPNGNCRSINIQTGSHILLCEGKNGPIGYVMDMVAYFQ